MKRNQNHKDTKSNPAKLKPSTPEAIRFIDSMDLWAIGITGRRLANRRGNAQIRFVLLNVEGDKAEIARVTVAAARQLMAKRKAALLQKMRAGKLAKARERQQASKKEGAYVG